MGTDVKVNPTSILLRCPKLPFKAWLILFSECSIVRQLVGVSTYTFSHLDTTSITRHVYSIAVRYAIRKS
jgi:hypothetical protein